MRELLAVVRGGAAIGLLAAGDRATKVSGHLPDLQKLARSNLSPTIKKKLFL